MVLIIDYRETKIIESINKIINEKQIKQIKPINKNLLLGDIHIFHDKDQNNIEDLQPLIIIERKTVSDIVSSIKDGRYNEQKARLNAAPIHNHNIIFLIEGTRAGTNNVHSAAISTLFYSGFSVLFSTSITDSAKIILSFDQKINKDQNKLPYYSFNPSSNSNLNENQTHTSYAAILKPEKKANICKENAWIIMLQQLPHISCNIATALMEKYINIPILIDAIKQNPNILDTFKILGSDGKQRKISSRAIASINQLLL